MPNTDDPNESILHQQLGAMRADATAIFQAGLQAVSPADAIQHHCRKEGHWLHIGKRAYDLSRVDRIFVVGAGKATGSMAQAMEKILGPHISDGLITVKYHHGVALDHIQTIEAGHPIPDANGMDGAQKMLAMVKQAGPEDLIIVLLSGGGSALMPLPAGNISLDEKQKASDALIGCGATIHEINTIRKHISAIKGGRLAQAAAPAQMATLILSDVVGDDLDVIASGPTVPDSSTYDQCQAIIERYALVDHIPTSIRDHLLKGVTGQINETPKKNAFPWQHVDNLIVGSNSAAIQAARRAASKLGYNTLILSTYLEGETRHVAQVHCAVAREILATSNPVAPPACLLSGGETTVTLRAQGKGGRNQEFALAAALAIDGIGPITVLSAGTDGTDGPTDAAGAIVDHTTVQQARRAGLDAGRHLDNNDAYPLFKELDALLITGPTQTNVMDLHIVIVQPRDGNGNTLLNKDIVCTDHFKH